MWRSSDLKIWLEDHKVPKYRLKTPKQILIWLHPEFTTIYQRLIHSQTVLIECKPYMKCCEHHSEFRFLDLLDINSSEEAWTSFCSKVMFLNSWWHWGREGANCWWSLMDQVYFTMPRSIGASLVGNGWGSSEMVSEIDPVWGRINLYGTEPCRDSTIYVKWDFIRWYQGNGGRWLLKVLKVAFIRCLFLVGIK